MFPVAGVAQLWRETMAVSGVDYRVFGSNRLHDRRSGGTKKRAESLSPTVSLSIGSGTGNELGQFRSSLYCNTVYIDICPKKYRNMVKDYPNIPGLVEPATQPALLDWRSPARICGREEGIAAECLMLEVLRLSR